MAVGIRSNPFAPSSFWRKPLKPAQEKHELSDAYVLNIRRMVAQYYGAATINVGDYSIATYTAPPRAPLVPVAWGKANARPDPMWVAQMSAVPIPAGATPPPGSDHALVIWQPSTKTLWELWQARKVDGQWVASWGGRIQNVPKSDGVFRWPYGLSASGLSMLGGLIRVNELRAGVIRHVVSFALPEVRRDVIVPPANRTDGRSDDPTAIPEGQRFQLDPDFDLSTIKLSNVARMIARAAQVYGLIVSDGAGAVAFHAEYKQPFIDRDGESPYPALFENRPLYKVLDGFPWERLIAIRSV